MSERAVPFHCPYCGDENLWPFESHRLAAGEQSGEVPTGDGAQPSSGHGTWECRSCLRAFRLSMIGRLARPPVSGGPRS